MIFHVFIHSQDPKESVENRGQSKLEVFNAS